MGLLGSLFTRGFRLCPPLRTAHPHAGPGAHALHCSIQSPGAGPRVAMPWEALSPAIYPLPPPSLTCCLSAVTSLNWTGGSVYLSSFSSGPRGGVVFDGGGAMLAAAASSPARPSSSTLLGHNAPNPSIHGQQLDPGCVDHPVAPPTGTRTRWFKLGARHLAARCPLGRQRSIRYPPLPQMPTRRHHLPVG